MNEDLRLSKVLPIVLLAIILILGSLYVPVLSLLLVLIPVPFALIGTLSNIKNNIISLVITFLSLIFIVKSTYTMDIFINSVIPGMIIGIIAKKVLRDKTSNKYEPIFAGTIVFILSIVVHFIISKYLFKIDILEQLLNSFNQNVQAQKSILESATNSQLLDTSNILNTFRNLIPSILFFRSMILSIVIYLVEVFTLKKMKYEDLSEIRFRNFYLPGNAILISFILYLVMIILSKMKTPLYTDAIFVNLQMVFDFMFIVQGIAVCIYFIRKWIKQGINTKIVLGALCIGLFGVVSISFIGMVDSVLDFRKVRICKSV